MVLKAVNSARPEMCIRDRVYRYKTDRTMRKIYSCRFADLAPAPLTEFAVFACMSVSYTHLDVYKRQDMNRSLAATLVIRMPECFSINCNDVFII